MQYFFLVSLSVSEHLKFYGYISYKSTTPLRFPFLFLVKAANERMYTGNEIASGGNPIVFYPSHHVLTCPEIKRIKLEEKNTGYRK